MDLLQKEHVEVFLSTYKELEALVDQNYTSSIFEYENTLDGVVGKKLQLCRQLRNYVQHNEDGFSFVVVSSDMIQFLQKLCQQERALRARNQDMVEKPFVRKKLTDAVVSGVKLLVSKDLYSIPILDDDKKLVGVLTRDNMLKISYLYDVTDKLTFMDVIRVVKPDTKTILFVKAKDAAKDTMEILKHHDFSMVLVTDNGSKSGKVLGQLSLT